jgi:hypothetical protein
VGSVCSLPKDSPKLLSSQNLVRARAVSRSSNTVKRRSLQKKDQQTCLLSWPIRMIYFQVATLERWTYPMRILKVALTILMVLITLLACMHSCVLGRQKLSSVQPFPNVLSEKTKTTIKIAMFTATLTVIGICRKIVAAQ